MTKLFAFGTLKKGFPLHGEGLDGAKCLGRCRTAEAYPMFVAGPWYAPMMLDEPGTGLQVMGELYVIDDRRLAKLDRLESLSKPGNFRIPVRLQPLATGLRCSAFVYVKARELATPIHTAYLDDYRDPRFVPPRLWAGAGS